MTKHKKYFGTDGIRGRVGGSVMTADFALKLGYAAGKVLGMGKPGKTIVIGKDTRVSGYLFESALEAGLVSSGTNIILFGPMPTPAVAWLTRTLHASAGIVISASHNPYFDNGIKFFNQNGEKLSDEQELAIEALLDKPMEMVDSSQLGKANRMSDVDGRYIEYCKNATNNLMLSSFKIVLDCAHGATYQIAPRVFNELGADLVVIGNQPDGLNINRDCGSTEVAVLREKVVETKADIGIALDGDGDRVVMVDHTGNEINGDQLIFMVAKHLQAQNQLSGGVVGTLMSNKGMEIALKELNIPFKRSKVGDRHVHQMLHKNNWIIGGESSGHILNLNLATTGDGIISALMVLNVMMETGKTLKELAEEMTLYPQVMININHPEPKKLGLNKTLCVAAEEVDQTLGDRGRVLIRPSGTEPKLRIMVEAVEHDLAQRHAEDLSHIANKL